MPRLAPHFDSANSVPAPDAHSPDAVSPPAGFLSFTLHAHLPYVINHGTWPHGMEWLFEAAAETYIPLLQMLGRLERDGIALRCNLDLSPILLEQLAHPVFLPEFPGYLNRKIVAAREDEAFFAQAGDLPLAATARFWQEFYSRALAHFNAIGHDIAGAFRHFAEQGLIRIITSAATHGFLPLLGTDESVRAQLQVAVDTHSTHLGTAPRGVWLPECGYRPAGYWEYPAVGTPNNPPGFNREGIDQALAAAGLHFFFVDTHLVDGTTTTSLSTEKRGRPRSASLYRPHCVVSPGERTCASSQPAVFARDPRTAVQVWSSDAGYPGDFHYLDFHKKRFPGGHRYWKVTGANVDIAEKQIYDSDNASDRVKVHAAHFADICIEALKGSAVRDTPPILCALFDAELFGHWWFEGVLWLEAVARELHHRASVSGQTGQPHVELLDCESYLNLYPPSDAVAMREGSWGSGGSSQVWLNPQTSWTWARLYAAEVALREIANAGAWRGSELGTRIAQQLCRELLLIESSDWQFLIATGAARDYAEHRFTIHAGYFDDLRSIYAKWVAEQAISEEERARFEAIEIRDSIFRDLDPGLWAAPVPVAESAAEAPATE
jgi:1,4-alpha-glucan branching enzyme